MREEFLLKKMNEKRNSNFSSYVLLYSNLEKSLKLEKKSRKKEKRRKIYEKIIFLWFIGIIKSRSNKICDEERTIPASPKFHF
jgi:hypothetical protein